VRNYNVGSKVFHVTAHTKTLRAPSVAKKVSRKQKLNYLNIFIKHPSSWSRIYQSSFWWYASKVDIHIEKELWARAASQRKGPRSFTVQIRSDERQHA